jgi:predicted metal-dependent HD superfamily phosphohydrolase
MIDKQAMKDEWDRRLGNDTNPAQLFDKLYEAYNSPERHYHGIPHIAAMLDDLRAADKLTKVNYLATWFHDAVYVPGMPDNEQKSANWAREALQNLNISETDIGSIYKRIIATKEHKALGDEEGDSFLDADMAILGTPSDIYTKYTKNVRKEFAFVPDEMFAKGRSDFIRMTLNMPRIFHTEYFHDRYEAQARKNLQTELQALS